jgi:hypothetical protein
MHKLRQMLWWMDRDDPRLASSPIARLGFVIVWMLGFLFLLAVAQLVLYLLNRFGNMGRIGP